MKYSGHRKLVCELSKLSKFNAFNRLGYKTNTDAPKFLFTNSAQRELVSICTQSNGTAINFPCIITLVQWTWNTAVVHYTFLFINWLKSAGKTVNFKILKNKLWLLECFLSTVFWSLAVHKQIILKFFGEEKSFVTNYYYLFLCN